MATLVGMKQHIFWLLWVDFAEFSGIMKIFLSMISETHGNIHIANKMHVHQY